MTQNHMEVQIKCVGRDVYIGSTDNATWAKLTVDAFRTLVVSGGQAFERAWAQTGTIFHVNDTPDSGTFIRIGDQVYVGTANVIRYVELTRSAVLAIFACGLQALDECFAHRGDWVPLQQQAQAPAA